MINEYFNYPTGPFEMVNASLLLYPIFQEQVDNHCVVHGDQMDYLKWKTAKNEKRNSKIIINSDTFCPVKVVTK